MIALARCNKTASWVLLHAVRAGSRHVLLSDPHLFRRWSEVSNEAKDMLHRYTSPSQRAIRVYTSLLVEMVYMGD